MDSVLGSALWSEEEVVAVATQVFAGLHEQWQPRFLPFSVECKLQDDPVAFGTYNSFIQVGCHCHHQFHDSIL
jgi:hypothetical protein